MAGSDQRQQRDWPAVIAAQASSGLSALAYCREHGICPSLFYRRRKQCHVVASPAVAHGFVELETVDAAPAASGVALVNAAGWRIELSPGFDTATLERTLVCVAGACCR